MHADDAATRWGILVLLLPLLEAIPFERLVLSTSLIAVAHCNWLCAD